MYGWSILVAVDGAVFTGTAAHSADRLRSVSKLPDQALVERALSGAPLGVEELLRQLTPTIQVRVTRALLRNPFGGAPRNIREEVEDLTQDVWVALFDRNARMLRRWDPAKGMSLRNFVGIIAQRHAAGSLGTRRHNPWYDEPVAAETIERAMSTVAAPDNRIAARQAWRAAMDATSRELSDRGRRMLRFMFGEQLDNDEIAARTGLTLSAIYKWRSRLTDSVRLHLERILQEESA